LCHLTWIRFRGQCQSSAITTKNISGWRVQRIEKVQSFPDGILEIVADQKSVSIRVKNAKGKTLDGFVYPKKMTMLVIWHEKTE
jgi:hypothetical protein